MKFQKILRSEWFFPIVLSTIAILVSLIPLFHRYNVTPKDKFFNGTYFYSDDYGYYASVIQQGIDGKWLVSDKYTSEPHNPSIMHEQYLLLGKLGGILHLSSPVTFHLGRALGGFFFLIVTYLLIQQIFLTKSSRYLAFLATFLTSGIPFKIIDGSNRTVIQIPVFWFTELNPFERLTPLFHYSLAWILLFIIFIIFIKFIKSHDSRFIILASIPGVLVSIPHPSTLPIVYLTFAIFLLLNVILRRRTGAEGSRRGSINQAGFFSLASPRILSGQALGIRMTNVKTALRNILFYLLFAISTLPMLFYLKDLRLKFPWNSYLIWEKINITDLPLFDYISSIGPAFFLGVVGVLLLAREYLSLKHGKQSYAPVISTDPDKIGREEKSLFLNGRRGSPDKLEMTEKEKQNRNPSAINHPPYANLPVNLTALLLIISYIVSVFLLLYPLQQYIGVNRVRILQTPIHVPFAILATFTVVWLVELFKRKLAKSNIFTKMTYVGFLGTLLFTFVPVFFSTLPYITHLFDDFSPLTYPTKKMVEAYNFLNKNTSHDKIVLSTYVPGNQIPYMSSNTVFLGHLYNTINYYKKGETANLFYQGKMTTEEAQKFLNGNRIDYIYLGPQEKTLGNLENYPFLKKIFDNGEVTIFAK